MPPANLTNLSVAEAAQQLAEGSLSHSALTEAHLGRIAALDPTLKAFITVTDGQARQQAAQLDQKSGAARLTDEGVPAQPLAGIPLAAKDLLETAHIRTTAGSDFLRNYVPSEDSAVMADLYAAGMVLVGKANMHEWAFGISNDNPFYGRALNPYDTACISGGSSGGSAVAVATGMAMVALGSDTRGSIRVPSSLCGVVGLKPTYGRVSLRGVIPLSWHLDHVGPMARNVQDVAYLLAAIANYDPLDPFCVDAPTPNYLADLDGGLRGFRVAVASDDFFRHAQPEVLAAFDAAAKTFVDLGATVMPTDLSWLAEAGKISSFILTADAHAFHRQRLEESRERFGPNVLARFELEKTFSAHEYASIRHRQSLYTHQIGQFFNNYDLLLTPTTPLVACPVAELRPYYAQGYEMTRFTAPFNTTGVPALSLPCGFTAAGLPIGLQMVAPHWTEAQLLQAAYAYEQAAGFAQRRPPH
jgi:aspartyl-tRNA(Asn)/glutamyl-tRNA(Gln) amidotransferase subunit A